MKDTNLFKNMKKLKLIFTLIIMVLYLIIRQVTSLQ